MPKSILKSVNMPGFAQPQDIQVSAALEFRKEGIVVAEWEIAHEPDDSPLPPSVIDTGKYVFPSTPAFIEAAHQKFFDMAMPGLMQDYLERRKPKPLENPSPSPQEQPKVEEPVQPVEEV